MATLTTPKTRATIKTSELEALISRLTRRSYGNTTAREERAFIVNQLRELTLTKASRS